MVKLLVNLLIFAAIIAFAIWQLVKVLKRSKKGGCAACDYNCPVKQQMKKSPMTK